MEKQIEKPNAPCKGCGERHEACHDTCEKFQEFRRKKDLYNQVVRKEKTKYWGDDFDGSSG